jgi:hypothetical protein
MPLGSASEATGHSAKTRNTADAKTCNEFPAAICNALLVLVMLTPPRCDTYPARIVLLGAFTCGSLNPAIIVAHFPFNGFCDLIGARNALAPEKIK